MIVSFDWLRALVPHDLSPEEMLAVLRTMTPVTGSPPTRPETLFAALVKDAPHIIAGRFVAVIVKSFYCFLYRFWGR